MLLTTKSLHHPSKPLPTPTPILLPSYLSPKHQVLENKNLIKYGLIIGGGGLTAWGIIRLASFSDIADKLTVNITRFDISVKGTEYLNSLSN